MKRKSLEDYKSIQALLEQNEEIIVQNEKLVCVLCFNSWVFDSRRGISNIYDHLKCTVHKNKFKNVKKKKMQEF